MLNEVFGEVFSRKFWRNYRAFLGPGLAIVGISVASSMALWVLVLGPYFQALQQFSTASSASRNLLPALVNLQLGFLPLLTAEVLAISYFQILLLATGAQVRRGSADLSEAVRNSVRKWVSYLGATGLLFAIVFVFGLAGGLLAVPLVLAGRAGVAVLLLLLIPVIGFGVYALVRLLFYPAAIAVDGERAIPSLVKSWRATRGRWWSLFGTFLLLSLILHIVAFVAGAVATLPLALQGGGLLSAFFPSPSGASSPDRWAALGWTSAIQGAITVFLAQIPISYGLVVGWEVLKGKDGPPPAANPSVENRTG